MRFLTCAGLSALAWATAALVTDASFDTCHGSTTYCERSQLLEDDLANDFDSSPSLSLLQRAATKKSSLDLNSTADFELNDSSAAQTKLSESSLVGVVPIVPKPLNITPVAIKKKVPKPWHQPHKVITAPTEYRLRLGIICLFGLATLVAFLVTSGPRDRFKSKAHLSKHDKKAEGLDSEVFLGVEQQILQDFIFDSAETYLFAVDDRRPLTFKQLREFIFSEACDVSRFGVAGNDRLAVMLGNVPELIVAFWAFSRQCCFAPINRKASSRETIFTLHDLPAKAVVVRPEDKAHFLEALLEVPIIECILDWETVGLFSLRGIECPVEPQPATRQSVALVLQTAGTTRKPKLVPLTHQNLILTGKTLTEMLDLTPEDRSLNLVPLYHISGISNTVIAPVLSHSGVICAPQFRGETAFELCLDYQPTWYFGSPTIHMLMMKGQDPPRTKSVRLIRNATAALLPSTADEMTKFWGCEILPGYGMSECTPIAGHQCGRLVRIASVGPAAAPKISIDEKGEILIKGHSVFSGYEVRDHMEEDPNIDAFEADEGWLDKFHTKATPQHERWFHTGDCGWVDELGYLTITGRFKELIIRGGENISPLEVEDTVHDERILEKAAFSVTHEELGEVVGLAVKTRVPAQYLAELLHSIRRNSNLDEAKLPEVIVSVDELPKGLAGKPKRIGLQKRLAIPSRSLHRIEPVAYTYSAQTSLVAVDFADEDKMGEAQDSLGLAKSHRDGIAADIRNSILAMYAVTAFFVVCFHGQVYMNFPVGESRTGLTIIRMLGGGAPGGMHWNMQCFIACAAFLQCQEPFSLPRLGIMLLCYFLYQWPFTFLVYWFAYSVSSEEGNHVYYVDSGKRWFVGVMMVAYTAFCVARELPYHGLQCVLLALLTAAAAIWPVNEYALEDNAPDLLNQLFTLKFVDGLHCWVGLIMVYFVVGYYGHKALIRVKSHPMVAEPSFQRRVKIIFPIIFLSLLFMLMSSPAAETAIKENAIGRSWCWDPITILLDQGASIVLIFLLSQSVRGIGSWLTPIGSCALGIYLGGGIAFFCPHTTRDMTGASFGIIINKIAVLPPLQEVVTYLGPNWPAQFFILFLYSAFQIVVFGMPLHWVYLKLLSFVDAQTKSFFG